MCEYIKCRFNRMPNFNNSHNLFNNLANYTTWTHTEASIQAPFITVCTQMEFFFGYLRITTEFM